MSTHPRLCIASLLTLGALAANHHAQGITVSQDLAKLKPGAKGYAASVAARGQYVLTGDHTSSDLGSSSGSAYVFARSNGDWVQQAKLLPSDGVAGDEFGISVALPSVGSGVAAVVGAHAHDAMGLSAGAAYVFELNGSGTWVQTAKLMPFTLDVADVFGRTMAAGIATVAISAIGDDDKGSASGAVYVYVKTGAFWTEDKLTASDGSTNAQFGGALALDGDRLVVGAPNADRVYIFEHSGFSWTQVAELQPLGGPFSEAFGTAVAVNGLRVAVTGDTFSNNGVYAFEKIGASWAQTQLFHAPLGTSGAGFGQSLALTPTRLYVGSPISDRVFAYEKSGTSWSKVLDYGVFPDTFGPRLGDAMAAFGDDLAVTRHDLSGMPTENAVHLFHRGLLPYGLGCPGTGGVVPRLTAFGDPVVNGTVTIRIQGGQPNAFGQMFLGFSRAQVAAGFGCDLLIGAANLSSYPIALDSNGQLQFSSAIPPTAAGISIMQQAFLSDAGGAGGFSNSNGLELRIP